MTEFHRVWSAATICLLCASAPGMAAPPSLKVFDVTIQSQRLGAALIELSVQTGTELAYNADVMKNFIVPPLSCTGCTVRQAFDALLKNTGLYARISPGGITILPEEDRITPWPRLSPESPRVATGMGEVLVTGTHTRPPSSSDDIHPLTDFNRGDLENWSGVDVNGFLQSRLSTLSEVRIDPQSPVQSHLLQLDAGHLDTSRVLPTVNGRRQPLIWVGGVPIQPSFVGYPTIAIERITFTPGVLVSLYGPGANAAVIDVKTRKVQGFEAQVDYESPTHGDAHQRSVSFIGGFSPWEHTGITFFGAFAERNLLTVGDRYGASAETEDCGSLVIPPLGGGINIRSATGAGLFGPGTPSCTSIPAGSGDVTPESLERNAGKYDLSKPGTAQPGGLRAALSNEYRRSSITARLESQLPAGFGLTLETGFGRNAVTAPYNPFNWLSGIRVSADHNALGQDLLLTVPAYGGDGTMETVVRNRQAMLVLTKALPYNWQVALDTSWATVDVEMHGIIAADGSDAFADGSIDVFRDPQSAPLDLLPLTGQMQTGRQPSELMTRALRFGGPVKVILEKYLMLSGVLEHSNERYGGNGAFEASSFTPGEAPVPFARLLQQRRDTNSLALEARFPLRTPKSTGVCEQLLEVMVAGRVDESESDVAAVRAGYTSTKAEQRYLSEQRSLSQNIGFCSRFSPTWMIRASGGQATQLTPLNYLVPAMSRSYDEGLFTDSRRGGMRSGKVTFSHGGNPGLLSEELTSWSAGIVLDPWKSFRVAFDYTQSDVGNPIAVPETPEGGDLAKMEALFPGRVTRATQHDDDFEVGPVESVNLAVGNGVRLRSDLYQLQLDYVTNLSELRFEAHTSVAYQPRMRLQYSEDSAALNLPLEWRVTNEFSAGWKDFTAGWRTHYSDRYPLAQIPSLEGNPMSMAPRWTSHDVYGRYGFPEAMFGVKVQAEAGVRNVFGERVPMNVGSGLSNYNSLGDPRGTMYYLTFRLGVS